MVLKKKKKNKKTRKLAYNELNYLNCTKLHQQIYIAEDIIMRENSKKKLL